MIENKELVRELQILMDYINSLRKEIEELKRNQKTALDICNNALQQDHKETI